MAFSTTFADQQVLVLSADDVIVWGTVMLGETYGTVVSMSISRDWNTEEIKNGVGGLAAFIWNQPSFSMSMETRFDSDITAPGAGDRIVFPYVGVTGRVIKPSVKWEAGGARMLSLECKFWDELRNGTGTGSAPLYLLDGTSYTAVDSGTAL